MRKFGLYEAVENATAGLLSQAGGPACNCSCYDPSSAVAIELSVLGLVSASFLLLLLVAVLYGMKKGIQHSESAALVVTLRTRISALDDTGSGSGVARRPYSINTAAARRAMQEGLADASDAQALSSPVMRGVAQAYRSFKEQQDARDFAAWMGSSHKHEQPAGRVDEADETIELGAASNGARNSAAVAARQAENFSREVDVALGDPDDATAAAAAATAKSTRADTPIPAT